MSKIQHAVQTIGNRARYQYILLAFFILVYIQLGLMLIGSPYIFMNPQVDCQGIIPSPNQDDFCKNRDICQITNTYTITYQAELFCDKQSDRNIIQSALYIGSIFGLIFLTPFADELGKKRMFVLSQGLYLIGLVCNFIGAKTNLTPLMVLGQICIGSGAYCILIIGYVILSELAEDKFKQVGIMTLNAVWAIAEIIIGGLYFLVIDWSTYVLYVLLLPNVLLTIFGFFYLVESPFYLLQKKGDLAGAVQSMKKIAAINNKDSDEIISQVEKAFAEVIEQEEMKKQRNQGNSMSRLAIFKDFKYLRILLLVAVLEIGANSYYYGIQFSLGNIGTNFGYNIILTGAIEFVAFFSTNFFITKVPRKLGTIVFNSVCIGLGMLFFIDMGKLPQTIILGAARFINSYSMAIVPMLQNEPFPHKYRSIAWGYIEGLSQIGNFITPYIVTACQNTNISALIVFSFMLIGLGLLPAFFIKETLGVAEGSSESEQVKGEQSKQTISQSLISN